VALPIRNRETERDLPRPPRIWLVQTNGLHRPLSRVGQFSLLPLLLLVALLLFALTFQGTVGMPISRFVHAYTDIPLTKPRPLPQTTFVYDRDGHLITTLHAGVNRTEVPLSGISRHLKDAVIALEDKDFYREPGVNFSAIVRAALVNLRNGRVEQGGSTITQQYVKNVYTGGQRTISRKIKEAILAQKLSQAYTKDQILGRYLNSVYFGRGAYGAEAAALTYFGVEASKLSIRQAALLAGLVRAPALYDPFRDPKGAKTRRDLALRAMAQQGYITWHQARANLAKPLRVKKGRSTSTPAAYFMDYVRRALQSRYGYSGTFTGGLRVSTTLDRGMQRDAESAIATHLRTPGDPSAALVAVDPRSGEIRALVGGRNFDRVKFNLATQAHRQTGSAFKPFTFVAALEQHIDPHAVMTGPPHLTIPDRRCQDPKKGDWEVSNYADESAGTMPLLSALAHSVNTIFAQLVVGVGPDNVVNVAHRMGIKSRLSDVCSITLGSQAVTPLEMTSAYATLAAGGVRHAPRAIDEVKGPDGKVIGRPPAKGRRVLKRNVADVATFALQGVIQGGTGTAANIGRPAAGKTGTAQNYQDAWFCGYVPQLAACVWMGYPKTEDRPMQNVEGFAHVFGGSLPAMIWHDFMVKALLGSPPVDFATPDFTGFDQQPERVIPLPTPKPSPTCRPEPRCRPSPSPSPIPTP
jgi:1A family penicillin-binding protein